MSAKSRSPSRSNLNKRPSVANQYVIPTSYYPALTEAQFLKRASLLPRGSKRFSKPLIPAKVEEPLPIVEYHEWKPTYEQQYHRTIAQKPMTKDCYHQYRQYTGVAREYLLTEDQCNLQLISPEEVNISKPVIYQIPSRSVNRNVGNAHRKEALPSSARTSSVIRFQEPEKNESERQAETISTAVRSIPSSLSNPSRLLNRPTVRDEILLIRRPPRRLLINVTYEKTVPLAAYG